MHTPRFSRRRFVAGAAVFGTALSVPWRAAWSAPEPTTRPLVPREVFFGNPDISWARLSHDGASIAYIAPVDGVRYGGYAALTAATRTPEVFACIVDIFGIANLLTFMAAIPEYWKPWFSVWKNRLGDPDTEDGRAFLRERSPITHIDRAVRPILIVQGLEDVRVTRAESEQMVAALRRRNAPVTYVTFPDEGHGFARPENQIAFRAVTEAFLAKHLNGRLEPIDRARDFKGSTLTVETGAELVPGLAG